MKKLTWMVLLMLTGCTGTTKPQPQTPAKAPAGLIKILEDESITSYVDFRVISTYQGNSHLRRFYFINNYAERTLIIKNPPVYVSSSRAIDVINCDKNQRAVMGRSLFPNRSRRAILSMRDWMWGNGKLTRKTLFLG